MNYEYLWKELEALAIELRSKSKDVPNEVIENLKAAKTLMTIQRVDPSSPVSEDIEEYLRMTEAALMSNAEYSIGKDYVDRWLRRLEEAKAKGLREVPKRQVGFVAGIPKGNDWVRVRVSELMDMKELDSIAHSLGLSKRIEAEDTVLLYGPPEKTKAFLRELTEKVKRK